MPNFKDRNKLWDYHMIFSRQKILQFELHQKILTSLATSSLRFKPYFATTGLKTSVTGLVGLAFKPTDRLIGTRSSLKHINCNVKYEIFPFKKKKVQSI